MINTTRLVAAGPIQISFPGTNQFGRESSLILALMKDGFKCQEHLEYILLREKKKSWIGYEKPAR
jgi:hypothetical protein